MKWFVLLTGAAAIAAASAFAISLLRPQTHNIGALFGDALLGGVIFFATLLAGYFWFIRQG
jgi:hypothetical protein